MLRYKVREMTNESFYKELAVYLARLEELKALSIELVFDNMIEMMQTDDDSFPF